MHVVEVDVGIPERAARDLNIALVTIGMQISAYRITAHTNRRNRTNAVE